MKVLHIIITLATGGAEKLVLDTVPLYNKSGIETDVLVFNNRGNYPFYESLAKTNSCKMINLNVASLYNPISIFKMIPILKQYDIAHVHLFPAQYFVVFSKLLSFSKIKLVVTEHSTTNRRLENALFKTIDKLIYRYYTRIVAISEKIEGILLEHTALPNKRILVIENGVAIDSIINATPLKRSVIHLSLQASDQIVIQVAGFREGKDQGTLIKALTLLPSSVKLLLVGDGVTRLRYETLVAQRSLQDRVFFLGVRSDIPQLLKTADIVVLSSHFEGMSLSSIEGMASGRPFIASDVPGLREMVKGHGLLFEDSNEKELAEIISKLLENKTFYNNVAAACAARAKKFDIQVMVNKHIQLYQQILND